MLIYPEFDPVIFKLSDSLQIRWYGLMYVLGFVIAWVLMRIRTKRLAKWENAEVLNDFFFYIAIGVIVGGRVGYVLFYDLSQLLANPLSLVYFWQAGRSFHGGLLGVLLAVWFFSYKKGMPLLHIADMLSPAVPIALGLGRVGNFINGELWGRVTDVPWAFVFPHVDNLARHPAQIYAILLEGVLLFSILWHFSSKPRKLGSVTGLFLLGYGCIRFFEEFFRQPDSQYGFIAFDWVTMGQLLSLPMVIFGVILLVYRPKQTEPTKLVKN